ncbi:ACP S-malonyltransferase [Candidatus Dependentiae bacterium]|nr:ACP S-malonyltransferase [Candidatus Dependentiae bacterium]
MKIGMLFPPQGSQFVGMGKELYDNSRIMQEYFEEASSCLDINFVKLCFASSDAEINGLNNAYTSLFLVSSALWAVLKDRDVQPDIVLGYNAGEYAALHAAGSLSLPDGLYLLNKYATLYQELLSDLDVSVLRITGSSSKIIEKACKDTSSKKEFVHIAVYESATQHIVAGHTPAVVRLSDVVRRENGIKIKNESIAIGLHSPLMQPVVASIKMYLEKIDFKDATIPIITNADAQKTSSGDDIKEKVIAQFHQPVLLVQSMELLAECDLVIEVGPGKQMTSLFNQRYPDIQTVAINTKSDLEQLQMILGEE